jgi:RNA polymerase Rpb2, domain 5./RNA polymerase I, Rpa2 specific domain.
MNMFQIPKSLEIVYLKRPEKGMGLYPGLYLFTGPGRMLRPVMNLAAGNIEWIGTFEQVFMDICITMKEAYPGVSTRVDFIIQVIVSSRGVVLALHAGDAGKIASCK